MPCEVRREFDGSRASVLNNDCGRLGAPDAADASVSIAGACTSSGLGAAGAGEIPGGTAAESVSVDAELRVVTTSFDARRTRLPAITSPAARGFVIPPSFSISCSPLSEVDVGVTVSVVSGATATVFEVGPAACTERGDPFLPELLRPRLIIHPNPAISSTRTNPAAAIL